MPSMKRTSSQEVKDTRILANRYKVQRKLGSGSFGTVFVVEDLKSDEIWKVLKEIPVGDLQPDETVSAVREARLLSKLDHPGIVKFHDSFIDGDRFCIVTEFCQDGDLDMKINERRKSQRLFDEPRIMVWFIQLLLAVQYMHERRILHRDLKTRNIFLHNNIIKVGDFGISRILMGTTDIATTFTGTPYYMSPEVLKHEGYNAKSDIWSLGVILYELCCLKRAFEGQNLMGVMFKIVQNDPPSISKHFSDELSHIYLSMLNKDPQKRPSASEILKHRLIISHLDKLRSKLDGKSQKNKNADADSKAIAVFLSASAKKGDIAGTRERKHAKTKETELRPMTPGERLKQRKQEKADQEARRLSQLTAASYRENRQKYTEVKSKHSVASATLPWSQEDGDWAKEEEGIYSPIALSSSDPCCSPSRSYSTDDDENKKDEFDFTAVSEIPDEEELANTYYSQADDFEEESCSGESSDSAEDEYDALMEHMSNALDLEDTCDSLMVESVSSSIGPSTPTIRNRKIESLRNECNRLLGEDGFIRAYDYLKRIRFESESILNEKSIMDGLKSLVSRPRDCFLVDQLLFLEKQEEIQNEST